MKDRQETMRFWRWIYQWKWTVPVIFYLICTILFAIFIPSLVQIAFRDIVPLGPGIVLIMLWLIPTTLYAIYYCDRNQMKEKYESQGSVW